MSLLPDGAGLSMGPEHCLSFSDPDAPMGEARTEKMEIPYCAWFDVPVSGSGRT